MTPRWLTAALAAVVSPCVVEEFQVEPVGTGQMADSFRMLLHYAGSGSALGSVVGKFTAENEQSRSTALSMRTSEVEVRFYQQLAATLPVRTPNCFYCEVDPSTGRFVLLLEDVAPATQGDQLTGCSVDQAALALEEMAMLHAPRWGDPRLKRLEWLNRRNEELSLPESNYPMLFAGFVDRYGSSLSEGVVEVGRSFFGGSIGSYLKSVANVCTVQHADFRADNLLFGDADGRAVVVDWQTVCLGPGAADLSYFLGGSISVSDRRSNEKDLVRLYHDGLCAGGVKGYDFNDLWLDYRRYAYSGLVMAVEAAMMVERTTRETTCSESWPSGRQSMYRIWARVRCLPKDLRVIPRGSRE